MYKIISSLHRIVYIRGSTSNLQYNVKGKQRHWGNKWYEKKLTWSWLWSLKRRSRTPVLCRGTLWRLKLGTLLKNHTKRWLKWVWTSEVTSLSDQFAGYRHIWGMERRGVCWPDGHICGAFLKWLPFNLTELEQTMAGGIGGIHRDQRGLKGL